MAARDGHFQWQVMAGGHELELKTWEIRVSAGDTIRLWYPFWKKFHIGDIVELAQIAKHPFSPCNRVR